MLNLLRVLEIQKLQKTSGAGNLAKKKARLTEARGRGACFRRPFQDIASAAFYWNCPLRMAGAGGRRQAAKS